MPIVRSAGIFLKPRVTSNVRWAVRKIRQRTSSGRDRNPKAAVKFCTVVRAAEPGKLHVITYYVLKERAVRVTLGRPVETVHGHTRRESSTAVHVRACNT